MVVDGCVVGQERWRGLTPVEVAAGFRHLPGMVFLDSAGNLPCSGGDGWSMIGACPVAELRGSIFRSEDAALLRQALAEYAGANGGLCGWIEYSGDFSFGVYPEWLAYDHGSGAWQGAPEWAGRWGVIEAKIAGEVSAFLPMTTREEFLEAVERAGEWIAAGDVYQVNLAQQFRAVLRMQVVGEGAELRGLYEVLRVVSPSPMGCWMARDGREVLGSSQELFLQVRGREVVTRPIKGTRPRFSEEEEDRRSAEELAASEKERAELVMITDLLRNDLGQVCEYGSVEVREMLRLESLGQVHHLVSTVCGRLREGEDVVSLLVRCFPGGSITGAPKKRAMEVIAELEMMPRGLYCGAMGYIGFDGDAEMNVAIRTLIREGEVLHYHVGAGIVADSDAAAEYEETLHKARGMEMAVEEWRVKIF